MSQFIRIGGTVSEVTPTAYSVAGLSDFAKLGDCVRIETGGGSQLGEVIRLTSNETIVKPYDACCDTGLGATAWHHGKFTISPHETWKGRVLNALAEPIDEGGFLAQGDPIDSRQTRPPRPLQRGLVRKPIVTGIRAIDVFTPLCAGQRIGVFAGSGIGKSTLLAMLARGHAYDAVVIALVGERGREVRDFVQDALAASMAVSTVVVATGDEGPMMRKMAPETAMGIAEFYRDSGQAVLLIVDSVTRYAHAARDVALASGEPPVARGYAPSVFTQLPRLLERAGPGETGSGSITGIFSVLIDGDDPNEPVTDCIRGTLDGHIMLSRAVADEGRFPAIDLLSSVSRLADRAWQIDQRKAIVELRSLISRYEESRDLRLMGGYQAGTDAQLDRALEVVPKLYQYLNQHPDDPATDDPFNSLTAMLEDVRNPASSSL